MSDELSEQIGRGIRQVAQAETIHTGYRFLTWTTPSGGNIKLMKEERLGEDEHGFEGRYTTIEVDPETSKILDTHSWTRHRYKDEEDKEEEE